LTQKNYWNELSQRAAPIHDRIEDGFSKPSDGEQLALGDALEILSTLRKVAEREISEQRRTGLKNPM